MRTTGRFHALAASLALVLLCSCGSDEPTSPDGIPTGERSTETFSGSLAARSAAWHSFSVQTAGAVDITLTTLGPDPRRAMGLGIGTTPTNGCDVQAWNNAAVEGTIITAPIAAGTFCVVVYDVGNVGGGVTYTVTVVHP